MKIKNKTTLLNIITSLLLQLIALIYGFLNSRLIIQYFGSNVNGLIASLNQFLSYITLIEGGITGVITAALYAPLVSGDQNKISAILVTTKRFFRIVGIIFIIYSIILGVVYPLVSSEGFDLYFVFLLTIILSLNLLIQYMLSLTYKTLLVADKKIYIVSISQILVYILNIVMSLICVNFFPNVLIYKLINGITFLVQPIIYTIYVRKNYHIDKKTKYDNELIKSRWEGFAINVAAFIHFSTDAIILTIFTNLKVVSVYSVYALVTSGLRAIVNSIATAITPTIGHSYAKGNFDDLNKKMDLYEYIMNFSVFFLFTVGALLITPFVMLYTKNINDAEYYQPVFGILIIVSEVLYLIKFPHLNLAYCANQFKKLTIPAFIEAGLNIVCSIVLVNVFGLIGVAIGTIIAMFFRLIYQIYFTTKIIESRHQWNFYEKIIFFTIPTIIGGLIYYFWFPKPIDASVSSWIVCAIIYSSCFLLLYFITSLIFFRKELFIIKNYLLKKNKKN